MIQIKALTQSIISKGRSLTARNVDLMLNVNLKINSARAIANRPYEPRVTALGLTYYMEHIIVLDCIIPNI